MHKIWLIIQREYLVRVRKKSFIIMTLVGPLLMAALMVVPIWLATVSDDTQRVEVLDESNWLGSKLKDDKDMKFVPITGTLEAAKKRLADDDEAALLYIPPFELDNPAGIKFFSHENTSLSTQSGLENMLKKAIEERKLSVSGVDKAVLDKLKTKVEINTVNLSGGDEKSSNAAVSSAAGYVGAFLIYIFIFMYGVQIMRGVIEEKTNRIVEVVISSVKPFQLMMGKILGIAAVGLTQFLLWIMLSTAVVSFVSARFQVDRFSDKKIEETMKTTKDVGQAKDMNKIISGIDNLNVPLLVGCFLFYFLGGYLLYGALFGAVGSAVDNETDTQQFMLPITIPLIMSFVVAQTIIIQNPNGPVAFWMSIIPFTSPISMMLRLPFGVPVWQLLLSMVLLIMGFVGTVWLAGRIYRVGILMYGKKVNYRELSKWLFYKG
jgi:ABC-2 type transport system permease protein